MAILGTLGAEGVGRAITLGDARSVQAAPGVGPKLAQRVILELKSKAPGLMAMGGALSVSAVADDADAVIEPMTPKRPVRAVDGAAQKRASASADALSALGNLGYGPGDAAQAVATVAADAPEADAAGLIRAALKLLAPK
jgi:Holliday junction DNA helicase RuvA